MNSLQCGGPDLIPSAGLPGHWRDSARPGQDPVVLRQHPECPRHTHWQPVRDTRVLQRIQFRHFQDWLSTQLDCHSHKELSLALISNLDNKIFYRPSHFKSQLLNLLLGLVSLSMNNLESDLFRVGFYHERSDSSRWYDWYRANNKFSISSRIRGLSSFSLRNSVNHIILNVGNNSSHQMIGLLRDLCRENIKNFVFFGRSVRRLCGSIWIVIAELWTRNEFLKQVEASLTTVSGVSVIFISHVQSMLARTSDRYYIFQDLKSPLHINILKNQKAI